jgi:GH18 family chitinase
MQWFKKLTKDKRRKKKSSEEKEKLKKNKTWEGKRELLLEKDTELDFLRNKSKRNLWALPNKRTIVKKWKFMMWKIHLLQMMVLSLLVVLSESLLSLSHAYSITF